MQGICFGLMATNNIHTKYEDQNRQSKKGPVLYLCTENIPPGFLPR